MLTLAPSGTPLVSGENQSDSVIFFRFLLSTGYKILIRVPVQAGRILGAYPLYTLQFESANPIFLIHPCLPRLPFGNRSLVPNQMPVLPYPVLTVLPCLGSWHFHLPGAGHKSSLVSGFPNSDPTQTRRRVSMRICKTLAQSSCLAVQPASLTVILSSASLLSLFPTHFPHSSQTVSLTPASFAQKFQGLPLSLRGENHIEMICAGQLSVRLSHHSHLSFCLSCSHTVLSLCSCTITPPPHLCTKLSLLFYISFHQIHAQFIPSTHLPGRY